jgi:hypothetical protein
MTDRLSKSKNKSESESEGEHQSALRSRVNSPRLSGVTDSHLFWKSCSRPASTCVALPRERGREGERDGEQKGEVKGRRHGEENQRRGVVRRGETRQTHTYTDMHTHT